MKKYFTYILVIILFASSKSNAQWISIPDANFRNALVNFIPSAFSSGLMDTTSLAVTGLQTINVQGLSISNLTGIQYFDNLQNLDCSNNQLNQLPPLPTNLIKLNCASNFIESLPVLPSTLKFLKVSSNNIDTLPSLPLLDTLDCYNCKIQTLPVLPSTLLYFDCSRNGGVNINDTIVLPVSFPSLKYLAIAENHLSVYPSLPSTLEEFVCASNFLTYIPPLPTGLKGLYCFGCPLTALPALPSTLINLVCYSTQISVLPVLPPNLYYLDCSNNFLTALPTLPNSLKYLWCSSNQLSGLPPSLSVDTALIFLECAYNQITSLPSLPDSLQTLRCDSNLLTTLPALPPSILGIYCNLNLLTSLPTLPPNLYTLQCMYNNINCLPYLPTSITELQGFNGGYTCLPNLLNFNATISGPSVLCDQYNTPCSVFPHISGRAFNDDNQNASMDSAELGHPNVLIEVQPGDHFTITNDSGFYIHGVDTGGSYVITIHPVDYYTIVPSSYSTGILNTFGLEDTLNDFALQRVGIIHDMQVSVYAPPHPRSGFSHNHHIRVKNKGTISDTTTVQYVHDNLLNYISASPAPDLISGDTLIWNSIAFIPGANSDFSIIFHIDSLTPALTQLNSKAVAMLQGDSVPSDNEMQVLQEIRNSFDPNYKTVFPEGDLSPLQVFNREWLTYTICFQNTGHASAWTVQIKDTLSANLDLSTFEIVSSSHAMNFGIANRVALFSFDNINLPDSGTNEVNSHGFVTYRVKVRQGLQLGDLISNTAYIYFDVNSPAMTNTILTTIATPNQVSEIKNNSFSIYPNPFTDDIHFTFTKHLDEMMELKIFDLTGRNVYCAFFKATANYKLQASAIKLHNGIYFVEITSWEGREIARIVRQ